MKTYFSTITINTDKGISLHNISERVVQAVTDSGISNGIVTITSQHTTTALTINEDEERLMVDICNFLKKLFPSDKKYLHNDIHLRDCAPDEPENAHSHIAAMHLGNSESIAIVKGELKLGVWQSIMLVELDGPRERAVSVHVMGT